MHTTHDPLTTRELANNRLASNVFIGEPHRISETDFETTSIFPRDHEFYNGGISGLSASGYLMKVARQANMAICHRFFDVPLDAGFLVKNIDWQFASEAPWVVQEPDPYVLRTSVVSTSHREDMLKKLSTRSSFWSDSNVFLLGEASFLMSSRRAVSERSFAARPSVPMCEAAQTDDAQVSHPHDVLVGMLKKRPDGSVDVPILFDSPR